MSAVFALLAGIATAVGLIHATAAGLNTKDARTVEEGTMSVIHWGVAALWIISGTLLWGAAK